MIKRTSQIITAAVFGMIAIVSCSALLSLDEDSPAPGQALKIINLDVCAYDPDNADFWRATDVNLTGQPGGTVIVKTVPACEGAKLKVLSQRVVSETLYYQVSYLENVGWQTKRLLEGE